MSHAPSTIAMSAYSITAMLGPCTSNEILNALEVHQAPCSEADLALAIAGAIERELMVERDGKLVAAGPPGWVASSRDPRDPEGWEGWVCRNLKTGESKPLARLLEMQSQGVL